MVITQTPLRLSLAGGGSDLHVFYENGAGKVLSTAIDKYIFVIIKERFDDKIVLNYSRNETVSRVDEIQHELIRESMKLTGLKKGVEISTLADIPSEGSGLGSSSSLVVGLLNAMYLYNGEQVTAERLAQEACKIEIDICEKPIGKQDQYIAAYGGIRTFRFNPDGSVTTIPVDIPANDVRMFGANLMLFYTAKTRKSASILTEQKKSTKHRREHLEAMLPLVDYIEKALVKKRYSEVGEALHEGWELKKRMAANISNPEIDKNVLRCDGSWSAGWKNRRSRWGGLPAALCAGG